MTIACGKHHTVVIDDSHNVWTFGNNEFGQLGTGDTENRDTPVQADDVISIKSVSAGTNHTAALDENGVLFTCGNNIHQQCGLAGLEEYSEFFFEHSTLTDVKSISCGNNFTLLYSNSLHLIGFGDESSKGLSGLVKSKDEIVSNTSPKLIEKDGNNYPSSIKSISSGKSHAFAIDSEGNVWGIGNNHSNRLGLSGDNINVLTLVPGLKNITSIAAGASHTIALDVSGKIWVFGSNKYGQLGTGKAGSPQQTPVELSLENIIAISAGKAHSAAIDNSGALWVFGWNTLGQLGTGDTNNRESPVKIDIAPLNAIACGHSHTVALDKEGILWSFGSNEFGQLGLGDNDSRTIPTKVLADFQALLAAK